MSSSPMYPVVLLALAFFLVCAGVGLLVMFVSIGREFAEARREHRRVTKAMRERQAAQCS